MTVEIADQRLSQQCGHAYALALHDTAGLGLDFLGQIGLRKDIGFGTRLVGERSAGEDVVKIIRRESPVGDLDLTDDFRGMAGVVVGQFGKPTV